MVFKQARQRLSDFIAPNQKQVQPFKTEQVFANILARTNRRSGGVVLEQSKYGAALAFNITVPIYTATNKRVKTIGRVYWSLKDQNDNIIFDSNGVGQGNLLSRAIIDFEQRFNLNFFGAWEMSRIVAGETFIYCIPNEWGIFKAIEWLNPLDVTVRAPTGVIQHYEYRPQHTLKIISPFNMVFDRQLNLLDENVGQSPIEVAIRKAQTIINGDLTMLSHLKNNARMGMSISPARATRAEHGQSQFDNKQLDAIEDAVMKTMLGAFNHNSTVVLPYPVDVNTYEIANIQPVIDLMDRVDKSIYEVLNVPPSIAGNPDTSRFQRSETDIHVFDMMIVDELLDIEQYMNRKVIPLFDPSRESRFTFDLSPFIHISEEDKNISDISISQYGAGIIDLKSARQMNEGLYKRTGVDLESLLKDADEMNDVDETETDNDDTDIEGSKGNSIDIPIFYRPYKNSSSKAFAYLPLFGNDSLIQIQNDLKSFFKDGRIEWQGTDTFHVTLCYADVMPDVGLKWIIDHISTKPIVLMIERHGLGYFDTPNGKVLHLKIEHQIDLDILQASVYEGFTLYGDAISKFSNPKDYKPHITLAYIPDDIDIDLKALNETFDAWTLPMAFEANEVAVGRDDYKPLFHMHLPELSIYPHRGIDIEAIVQSMDDWTPAKAIKELNAYRKFLSHTKNAKRIFDPTYLRGDIFDFLLESGDKFVEIDRHISYLDNASKSINGIIEEFKTKFKALLDKPESRNSFFSRGDDLIRVMGRRAYEQGLENSGVRDEPNSNDRGQISALVSRHSEFLNSLADTMFGDNPPSEAQMARKPDQWANKTIYDFYYEGLLSGRRNPMLRWERSPEKKSCKDCLRLNGQQHRANDWKQSGWKPKGTNLDCHGDDCGCDLKPSSGRSRGNF